MKPSIRLATPQDAAQILEIYGPFCESTPVSFELCAPTQEEMEQRIRTVSAQFPWLVCEQQANILGYAYASRHRERAAYQWSVDVAVYIRPENRRLGIGRALYTSLFALLTLQGYFNAYAGITLPNPGSVGLHEAMGFQPVGIYRRVGYKLGAWHDVGWWQRRLKEESAPPVEPVAIHTLRQQPTWETALDRGLPLLRFNTEPERS